MSGIASSENDLDHGLDFAGSIASILSHQCPQFLPFRQLSHFELVHFFRPHLATYLRNYESVQSKYSTYLGSLKNGQRGPHESASDLPLELKSEDVELRRNEMLKGIPRSCSVYFGYSASFDEEQVGFANDFEDMYWKRNLKRIAVAESQVKKMKREMEVKGKENEMVTMFRKDSAINFVIIVTIVTIATFVRSAKLEDVRCGRRKIAVRCATTAAAFGVSFLGYLMRCSRWKYASDVDKVMMWRWSRVTNQKQHPEQSDLQDLQSLYCFQ